VAATSPGRCFLFYWASFVCDELDGRAARAFSQTSTLGAVLDMVTDRVATSCLLAVLCTLYPRAQPALLALLMLDIFSHWFQMYATLAMGDATHKDTASRSWVVRYYYTHRIFMGFCCCCCEALYLTLYLLATPAYAAWGSVPLPAAARPLLAGLLPPGGRVPALALWGAAMLPGFAIKQLINVVQLRTAAAQMVQYDQQQAGGRRGAAKQH
jgi:CDP-diacylglycerol--inositol 3-phosphatidyltransferase